MKNFQIGEMIAMAFLLFVFTIASACASKQVLAPALTPQALASSTSTGVEGEVWQKDWESFVRGAKKEGSVVVYGSEGGEVRPALMQGFQTKFGIQVDYLAARGPELVPKITAQRNAGLYLVDILLAAGAPGAAVLKPAGTFDPLESAIILPEVKEPKNWYDSKLPWMDPKERTTMGFLLKPTQYLAINTNLVKPGEINSYRDLLNPKWRGRILIADPIAPGSFTSWVGFMANDLKDTLGIDYLRKLAEQEPAVVKDIRLQAEWLAQGKYSISIATRGSTIEEFRRAGAPVNNMNPVEGTQMQVGSGIIRLINKAPHPNAARLFINWLLSKEGQTTYSKATGEQSAREDVPVDHIDPQGRRQPGVKYIVNNSEEWLLESSQREKLSNEIFGHLVK